MKAQYESQLAAAIESATDALEASKQDKAAAAAAHTAAAAAAERESLVKQALREAEERCVAASSQLGAAQQQVRIRFVLHIISYYSMLPAQLR